MAEPSVIINEAMEVVIDGKHAGKPVDCLVNHPDRAGDIQRAMTEWMDARTTQKETALSERAVALQEKESLATQLTAKQTAHEAALAALNNTHATAITQKEAALKAATDKAVADLAAKQAEKESALTAKEAEKITAIALKETEKAEAIAAKEAVIAEKEAKIIEQEAYVNAVAGMPKAKELAKENRLVAITKEKEDIAAKTRQLEEEEAALASAELVDKDS